MVVFVFVFSKDGQAVFRWCALSDSGFCSTPAMAIFPNAFTEAGNSLISNANLISAFTPSLSGACQCSDREFFGFSNIGNHFSRIDALVWVCA